MNKNKYITSIDVRRRALVFGAAACSALAWAGSVRAQAKPPVVIGWFAYDVRERYLHRLVAFKEGMAELGWKEGVHYVLEERWAQGKSDQLPTLAAEIAAKKPAIIVTTPTPPTIHVAKVAPNTPIVQANGDPSYTGLVKSYARPGGMVTGLSNINAELTPKMLELLRDATPKLKVVGFLADPKNPGYKRSVEEVRRAAEQLQLTLRIGDAVVFDEIAPAMARLAKEGAEALILGNSAWFLGDRARIMKLGLARRWPIIGSQPEFADAGALLTYGVDRTALFRRAAYFVDRILKGAKPADLPIELPSKFETVVNLRTAKTLGLTIPQSVMVRASRVIE